MENAPITLLQMLASRLEHLSVDSRWAHRASGLRRNILKIIEESGEKSIAPEYLDLLLETCFSLLEKAAREIPDPADDLELKSKN